MRKTVDFVIVGSGGGGGTIAWLLAKAGFSVELLEQGADWSQPLLSEEELYDPSSHDEYRFRIERPELKRRLRGDYCTFRKDGGVARPFSGGWTGSQLGGGSVLWGGWGFRALPVDFVLRSHYAATGQIAGLDRDGYAVTDWPVGYAEMEPYYNLAETLFTVCGDRKAINRCVTRTEWYKAFAGMPHFAGAGNWTTTFPFPQEAYPQVPAGEAVRMGLEGSGRLATNAPSAMIHPKVVGGFSVREALDSCLDCWPRDIRKPHFWRQGADAIWSDRVRDACTMCGFCGEYQCWGRRGPKSSTRTTTLRELGDLPNTTVRFDAKAFEIAYDHRTRRGSGVRYLNLTDPDHPEIEFVAARHVVVSCGAVQSARLLLMSGPPGGLGNRHDQLGRNATFHLFGLGASCTFPPAFQGLLRNELGHTGNTVSYDDYFVRAGDEWIKGGIVVSAARKNPLEGAIRAFYEGKARQLDLLTKMREYNRSLEVRITGDDLPMPNNRVDLDPTHVDEHGLPVARITRRLGSNEIALQKAVRTRLAAVFETFGSIGASKPTVGTARVELTTDHQFGTCRMGDDPRTSVVDRWCRLHDVPNVFVVDSSVFPTGLGVNPMMTVVANALRVGSWITENARQTDGFS